jgi:protein TonB
MPHDLFGDLVARPLPVRSRRPPLVVASLAAHGLGLVGAAVASIVAPETLPFPQRAIAYTEPVRVQMADIELPHTRVRAPRRATTGPVPAVIEAPVPAAPVIAPTGVADETGREAIGSSTLIPESGWPQGVGVTGLAFPEPVTLPPPPSQKPAVRLHSGIRAPRKIVDVAPAYPLLARQSQVEGVVILEATIDAGGQVQAVQLLRSAPLLDQAALEAVRQWRYEPATLNGEPVPVIMTITVRFALR